MKYYHNSRCSKSRAGMALLEEKGVQLEIVEYMKNPLKPNEMEALLDKLGMPAEGLIRKQEKVWREEFKDKELSEDELILAMIEHPNLMERPILEAEDKAVVGRPPEKLLEIL